MFASVAILERVASFRWGNVVGAPKQLLKLTNAPERMSSARLEAQGVHCGGPVLVICRTDREDVCEVA